MTLPDPWEWPVDSDRSLAVTDLLRARAESTPDRTLLVDADEDERWSAAEFDRRVALAAAGIDALPGEGRVGTLLSTGVPFAEVAFAVPRIGRTLVPLNVRLDRETLADQVERAGIEVLLCNGDTAALARAVAGDDVTVADVDALDDSTSDGGAPSDPRDPDAERLVMFTSGTTGRPKGVRLTTANLVASASASADRLGVDPDDRWLICLPMYHMGGLAPLLRSTVYGTTAVLQREFDADETAEVMRERDVTGVSLVPTALTRLLDAGWTPPESLRFVLLGGGPAPADLIDRCERHEVPVFPTYGLTETASQVATATPEEAFDHEGTVGRPLRDATVSIVADGSEQPPGEAGEVVVDGPTVTPGYLDDAATAAAFGDRGLYTGDRGYLDADGRLWILGRADDVIVTGGENVRPAKVADALREHPAVDDAAVVGVPDDEWGERVAALVVPGGDLTVDDLRARARDELPAFAVPKTVRFVDRLPRTASGTVDRERARELLA
ncbi:class I adenylate-forming enzyme family protein [Halomicrobium salinisoli]|uniref:class I adenylate-forming enzyme family protein n=1 Tax=Halomicrobium salinisoli TaxID=2878391 RepID=UPI001CF09332|nr:AMP-binding protein [Halomicrobium salinisoli]